MNNIADDIHNAYEEGYKDGMEFAKNEIMEEAKALFTPKWISVKDRLPKNGKALERLVKSGLEIAVRLDCEKNFLVDCKNMYASDGIFEKSFAGYGSTIEEAAEDYIAKFQGEKMYVKDEKGVKRVLVL